MKLPYKDIDKHSKDALYIGFFAECKSVYSSGLWFDFNILKASKIMKCSHGKMKHHFEHWMKSGWAEWKGKHLQLKKLYTQGQPVFKIKNKTDLYFEIAKNIIQQKKYSLKKHRSQKRDQNNPKDLAALKSAKKGVRFNKRKNDNGIYLAAFAEAFNLSISNTSKILNSLAKQGKLKIVKRIEDLGVYSIALFKYLLSQGKGVFKWNGRIKSNKSSLISLG